MKRLYEITVVSETNGLIFKAITTDDKKAVEEFTALLKLNSEDRIGLYSAVNDCNEIDYKRII